MKLTSVRHGKNGEGMEKTKKKNPKKERRMETRTVKLLKVMPNMSRQVKPTLVVEPKLREGDKDLEHRD